MRESGLGVGTSLGKFPHAMQAGPPASHAQPTPRTNPSPRLECPPAQDLLEIATTPSGPSVVTGQCPGHTHSIFLGGSESHEGFWTRAKSKQRSWGGEGTNTLAEVRASVAGRPSDPRVIHEGSACWTLCSVVALGTLWEAEAAPSSHLRPWFQLFPLLVSAVRSRGGTCGSLDRL